MNKILKGYCAICTVALLGKSVIHMILRHVTYADIPTLSRYAQGCGNMSVEELRAMIDAFDAPRMDGKYFEMFAVEDDDQNMVGTVSLFQHTKDVVSAGPEIFAPYRGRGFATEALNRVYALARAKGYRVAVAQVRVENAASIALHHKCGFEIDHEFVNQKGNRVLFFIKSIL